MRPGLLPIVATLALLHGCATRSGSLDAPPGVSILPSSFTEDACCLLHVRISGTDYRMLLDTGSNGCVVSDRIAKNAAGSKIARGDTLVDYTRGDVKVEATHAIRLDEVVLGKVRIVDLDAVVIDLSLLCTALGQPIDGLIGLKPFRTRVLTIDYPRRCVSVGDERLREDRDTLPIRHPHLPMVDVSIGRARLRAVLDSGSGLTALRPRDADGRTTGVEETIRSATISGEHTSRMIELAVPLDVGPLRFDGVRASVHDTRYPRIGLEELRRLRVTFDQLSRLVRLERVAAKPPTADSPSAACCERHDRPLLRGTAPVVYGLPNLYLEALAPRSREFPHANSSVNHGCGVIEENPGTEPVWFCPDCRAAERAWFEAHGNGER